MKELWLWINSHESYLCELSDKTDMLRKCKEDKIKELIFTYWTMN